MRTLFSFVGSRDPVSPSLPTGQLADGPILTLVKQQQFDQVVLMVTPVMKEQAKQTVALLKKIPQPPRVSSLPCPLRDPTDHLEILQFLRNLLKQKTPQRNSDALYAAVASGTPQMHACWVLLAASDEYPLTLLQLRNPRYVTADQPIVTALDMAHPDFPRVLPARIRTLTESEPAPDWRLVQQSLGIIGSHPRLEKALKTAARVAPTSENVLILGETGVGKELAAQFIHRCSERQGDFVPVNCGGLPEALAESELFGYVKGAFTGANKDKAGLFVEAEGGTLFLDELGEMPLSLQVKLLRALQEKKIRPVGATREVPVNARIVAATNVAFSTAIQGKTLREDLYYRVAAVTVELPPLRKRTSDIPALVAAFMAQSPLAGNKRFTGNALRHMRRYAWPGNLRELNQVVKNALIMTDTDIIDADDLDLPDATPREAEVPSVPDPYPGFNLRDYMSTINQRLKQRALEMAGGNGAEAARLLGISKAALSKDINKHKQ